MAIRRRDVMKALRALAAPWSALTPNRAANRMHPVPGIGTVLFVLGQASGGEGAVWMSNADCGRRSDDLRHGMP